MSERLADAVDSLSIHLGWVEVRRSWQKRKPGIDLRTGQGIRSEKGLIGSESLDRSLAKVGIDERTVVDAAIAANDVLVVEEPRFPGKTDARFKILVIDVGPGFTLAAVAACAFAGKNQRAGNIVGCGS